MSLQIVALRMLAFVVFLLLWWAASVFGGSSLVPTPLATAEAAVRLLAQERIYRATLESLSVYAAGYAIAALVAIPLGLVMGGFRILGRTLDVYVNALSATPRVAFIPLIIGLLGLGFNAKVSVVFLGAVIPILLNTYVGVLNADGELVEMVRSTGANRLQTFGRILLPGAMPFIIVGLRLGATIGLINTVVAELYTAISGLGGLLAIYGNTFQMAPYFVVVLILALIGVTVTQLLSLLESRMDKWRYRDT
jgi:NitT/TauT family transport system permease protein